MSSKGTADKVIETDGCARTKIQGEAAVSAEKGNSEALKQAW